MSKLIMIGCGKVKLAQPSPARDLYVGPLFRKRLAFAERSGSDFVILSAKFGLIAPERVIAPYDLRISDLSPLDQIAWALGVSTQLCERIDNDLLAFSHLRRVCCEIHAGSDYADRLVDVLISAGFSASWPMRGMSQGEQMRWYTSREVA